MTLMEWVGGSVARTYGQNNGRGYCSGASFVHSGTNLPVSFTETPDEDVGKDPCVSERPFSHSSFGVGVWFLRADVGDRGVGPAKLDLHAGFSRHLLDEICII